MFGAPILHHEGRPGEMRDTLADRTRADQILGWRPKVSIAEGIADLLKREG
jgi:nucleoside-diphosphate-sugar epimerase